MNDTVLVNLHCHSIFSDGEQTPEALAANLAAAGVRYAALTDHDTLEGLPRFQDALKKRGVACLPGVELTTQFDGREAHLLGYGFDPQHPDLDATLLSLRQVRDLEVHSIAGSLRKIGASRAAGADELPGISAAPDGRLEIGDAIDLMHRAGGRAFWAHPLVYESDLERLDACVAELKARGWMASKPSTPSISEAQRDDLRQLAAKYDLLVCAGTDFHAGNGVGQARLGHRNAAGRLGPLSRGGLCRRQLFEAEAVAPDTRPCARRPARGRSAGKPAPFPPPRPTSCAFSCPR